MRDKRFVAEHRGGPLKMEQHRQLMNWARTCAEHILQPQSEIHDNRLGNALTIAREWEQGNSSAGDAMKASRAAHSAARDFSDPVAIASARAIGHAVATAHMADHSVGAALYALKAVKFAGQSIEAEKKWQNEQLSAEIRELVLSAISLKEKYFIK